MCLHVGLLKGVGGVANLELDHYGPLFCRPHPAGFTGDIAIASFVAVPWALVAEGLTPGREAVTRANGLPAATNGAGTCYDQDER